MGNRVAFETSLETSLETSPETSPERSAETSPDVSPKKSLEASSFLCFADIANEVGRAAGRLGLQVPSFRSPPLRSDVDRSIRWSKDGRATVAVRVRGRNALAVERDVVEGVLQSNHLVGEARNDLRLELLARLGGARSRRHEPAA